MDKLVYALCTIASVGCAIMLFRGYFKARARLLFWSGLCFILLAVANALLYIDLILLPTTISLVFIRSLVTLAAVLVLLYGLIWETA